MPLSRSEVRTFYDRFGSKQDKQGFYEDPAIDVLLANAGLQAAGRVFEFGCGTGRLAERMLRECLPSTASYLGADLSPVMASLARDRLTPFRERADVQVTDGSVVFPVENTSVDCVISTYVLDLLADGDIRQFMEEAQRVLRPSGRLGLISLTEGTSPLSRVVVRLWKTIYRLRASLVGGCRPIRLAPFVDRSRWSINHRQVVTPYGVPSEVLVARLHLP
jgi:ubiquinone/menaquinone biosynthesis C-methylase UbiE